MCVHIYIYVYRYSFSPSAYAFRATLCVAGLPYMGKVLSTCKFL